MPDLPRVAIENANAHARILGSFDTEEEYQRWAKARAVEHALAVEQSRMQARALEEQRLALAELRAELEGA